MMTKLGVLTVLLVFAGAVILAGDVPRIEVPTVDWFALVPYLKANINVTYENGRTKFGGFSSSNRELFPGNYDPVLDELAKVIIVESLNDRHVHSAVSEATKALDGAGRPAGMTPLQNNERYWQRLSEGGEYLHSLRRYFERVRSSGTMTCYPCGNGYQLEALRVLE